jgi:hypothetical protein
MGETQNSQLRNPKFERGKSAEGREEPPRGKEGVQNPNTEPNPKRRKPANGEEKAGGRELEIRNLVSGFFIFGIFSLIRICFGFRISTFGFVPSPN